MNEFLESLQEYISEAEFSTVSLVLISVLGVAWLVQIFFYTYYYNGVIRKNKQVYHGEVQFASRRVPVSVIVTAKYASEDLEKYLPKLLDQNYPEYEVIVVNDGATEESTVLLDRLKEKHKNLKTSFLPMNAKYMSRRKMCITVGIKAAKYDHIVVTDSFCEPESRDWLNEMMRNFTPETEIVLGYAHQEYEKSGFLASLLRFDNIFGTMKSFGYAGRGLAYKGTACNMAFKKDTFFRGKGYASHLNLERGEDDVFVAENNNGTNVRAEISPSSFVTSHKETTFKKFLYAKDSDEETGEMFPGAVKFRIGLELTARILFYALFLFLAVSTLVQGEYLLTAIIGLLFLIRYGIQCYTFTASAHILKQKGYAGMFMVYELLIPVLTLYIITIGRIGKQRLDLWKM